MLQHTMIAYKNAERGTPVQTLPYKRFSEVLCSKCNEYIPKPESSEAMKSLTQKVRNSGNVICPHCKYNVNINLNEAFNIAKEMRTKLEKL